MTYSPPSPKDPVVLGRTEAAPETLLCERVDKRGVPVALSEATRGAWPIIELGGARRLPRSGLELCTLAAVEGREEGLERNALRGTEREGVRRVAADCGTGRGGGSIIDTSRTIRTWPHSRVGC